jgi:hypothetical protein
VVVNGGKVQFISVKAVNGAAALTAQKFTVSVQRSFALLWYGAALLAVIIASTVLWYRGRKAPTVPVKTTRKK